MLYIILVVIPLLIFLVARLIIRFTYRQQKKVITEVVNETESQMIDFSVLKQLPDPVQRYLRLVLTENEPFIRSVRLKHDGYFKTNLKSDWVRIRGELY